VQELGPVKSLHEEIISVEKPILGHFRKILPFSTANKWVTKPIFQSNFITVVWRMYREKGFQWKVIGNEALLHSYYQLKSHFLPFWKKLGCHCKAIALPLATQWRPNGTQVGANWHDTRLSGSNGEGQYYSLKLFIELIVQSNRGDVHDKR